jgi:voltage-gated potassium channel
MARLLVLAAGLGVVYALIPLQNERWWLGLVIGTLVLLAIVPFTVRRAAAIETSSQPLYAAAEAVIIVVAMLTFAFSSAYLALNRRGGAFVGLETKIDALYFTVATMSTVGFGDVHAVGQSARMAVTIQILVDLSLLAISIRVIVKAAQRRRQSDTDPHV